MKLLVSEFALDHISAVYVLASSFDVQGRTDVSYPFSAPLPTQPSTIVVTKST